MTMKKKLLALILAGVMTLSLRRLRRQKGL